MNYIIMDLEWNQALSVSKMIRDPVMLHGEIIQIGAVKADERFNLIDKIKINVRPKYYKKMNSHVEALTGISQAQLTVGETFPQAFRRFSAWCGEEFRFITWGFDDLGVFADNLTLHGLDSKFGADYINLQLIYKRQTGAEHLQNALSTAAESLGIPIDVRTHDALGDAYLTWEICQKLDMATGIAEYAEYVEAIPAPLSKDSVTNVTKPNRLLEDKRVTDIPCPDCCRALSFGEWLFSSGRSCKCIAHCGSDGDFTVKLKAVRVADSNYTVTRTVFRASAEDVERFNEKLKKREEHRKKVKQVEDKNDKNDTD